ncbi:MULTISPECIES: protein kinase [Kitasatospora]|uniref:non-specific serine/threonine protein kinase n=1 Tax=Kitasatospora setae (strain ATCC 33774 / DSM 43861 / JCM 3304 / KCC A-0304 / NBRC 14216 / KM-6054) TaxID=452652 RepID=E4MZ92_KITSK|nr:MULTISPECIES: protein kinase [Kitasatospora]BAJ29666.1 putative serine/threonine protein kinase [Kitasatospora setae KM-6054]
MGQSERPDDGGDRGDQRWDVSGTDAHGQDRGRPEEVTGPTEVLSVGPRTPGRGSAVPFTTIGDGRYRLTHRLGRGGMAEVFAAQDIRLGRTVAVKLLRSELAEDDTARLRFTREAHAVAALNHHSIVAVYDTGEEQHGGESTPYIVMELVEGRTVRELLVDEEAPPVDQALIITAGVLEALAYSHRHGIVHRDIKPANVIITTGGAVKVMDFGIARALAGGATTMTQTGMVMGTPQYLSPEQALGKAVDHRSDLYAAGCMLYELLTLRPPFTGETPLSVVYQHVQDAPVPPSRANDRVPAPLDGLVLRALEKNPDDRFQSADEFRAHVQHALRQMHGAAGAGYPAGAAGLAAAAAAGAWEHTPPTGSASLTEPMNPVAGSAPTEAMPYQVTSAYQTPATPYQGPGGGGGDGGGGDDGEEPGKPHRRNPWGWVLGVVALVLAATIGVALALTANNDKPTPKDEQTTAPVQSPSPQPTGSTPVERPTPSTPTRSQAASHQPETPVSTPPATPTRSTSPSPSPSASSSRSTSPSPSPSPSASDKATGPASSPPPATGTANPAPTGTGGPGHVNLPIH